MNYIAYYRVSTKKQGISGLGIEAQKTAVSKFLNNPQDNLLKEFQDIESGKKDNRPELKKAIEYAQQTNSKLIIAKLDRLSRNASFIFTLRDSKVDFICVDMPNANSVTIGIMAVLAQDERERISQRTKAALAELKKKGRTLGSPKNLTNEARQIGLNIRIENSIKNQNNRKATALIVSMKNEGKTFYYITKELNKSEFKTSRGKVFQQIQVERLYNRYTTN
jgi:DNA invertase Pin-like site-specific DNA recombinase